MNNLDQVESDFLSERHDVDHPNSEFYDDDSNCRPPLVNCKHCGREGLIWRKIENKFMVCNIWSGSPHVCPAFSNNPLERANARRAKEEKIMYRKMIPALRHLKK